MVVTHIRRRVLTAVPLGAAATFLSPVQNTLPDAVRITGTAFADQAGTLNVDQSSDEGQSWDFTSTFAVGAAAGVGYSVEMLTGTWRIRYVNGATPQTVFRLSAFTRGVA